MCGITGIFAHNFLGEIHSIHLAAANQSLAHRGPDFGRIFGEGHIGLAHRRLSIIDLSAAANQPLTLLGNTLAYNGEVFNFQELRNELESQGIDFQTNSDTEVVLQLLNREGVDGIQKLNGFFSFAYYNSQTDQLILARDRFGIKPLYYYHDEDKLVFGSEIQAVLSYGIAKELNSEAIYNYFRFNYIPAPHTAYQNIWKLLPGHYLIVKKKQVSLHRFFHWQTQTQPHSYPKAKNELLTLLEQAIQKRLISDVALGTFLSGGVDSSLITALASRFTPKLNTFSIGYRDEPQYDESRFAAMVAKRYQTEHTLFNVSQREILDCAEAVINHLGEPFADSSALPVYLLSKLTRKKVTVALSGDGADELFGGYQRYTGEWMAANKPLEARVVAALGPLWAVLPKSRKGKFSNLLRRFDRFAQMCKLAVPERYLFMSSFLDRAQLNGLFSNGFSTKLNQKTLVDIEKIYTGALSGKDFNEILLKDCQTLLPDDMLTKVDLMSMAHGLEVRPPFLDNRVAEFAFSLPAEFKIEGKKKKIILQDIAKSVLPAAIFDRPKHGFDVPLYKSFQAGLRDKIEALFNTQFIKEQGIFCPDYISNLSKKVFTSTNYDQNHVWAIVVFQHWWKQNFG